MKTSEEWYQIHKEKSDLIILDPDGWDRSNYVWSFYVELISEEEFLKRLSYSTIKIKIQ